MDRNTDTEVQSSPQLTHLREGLRSALTSALKDREDAIVLDYSHCENQDHSTRLRLELAQRFGQFIEQVIQFGDLEINAWCGKHGLDHRLRNVANARADAKYINGHEVEPKVGDNRISVKRDEVQRLTDLIRKEETNSAHLRVMLARKEDAAKAAQGRIRDC